MCWAEGIRRIRFFSVTVWQGMLLLACYAMASTAGWADVLLFDDSTSQRPSEQPWLAFAANGVASQTIVPGTGVRLTSSIGVSAGYSNRGITGTLKNPAFPVLNRQQGFSLNFELKVNSENHSNTNRAGFSTIVLTSDARGIELGFWEQEVWAQSDSPLFTHAEGAAFNNTVAEVDWRLSVFGNAYSLYGNNSLVLNGALRDYSSFGFPYTQTNFLFLGDNTSSAGADVTLGAISLAAVPEPSFMVFSGLVAMCILCRSKISVIRTLFSS